MDNYLMQCFTNKDIQIILLCKNCIPTKQPIYRFGISLSSFITAQGQVHLTPLEKALF